MTYKEQSEIRYRAILKLEAKIRQLEKENAELEAQIEKMQETLKSDLIARLKENISYSTSPSCTKGMELFIKSIERWEIKKMNHAKEGIRMNDYRQDMLDDCERVVREEPNLEYDMVVRKSWAEYAKEINRMRAQLRYMKKAVVYHGGRGFYENQRDIIKQEKEIKRLCKLRDCAKAMEKASGLKIGEMNNEVSE